MPYYEYNEGGKIVVRCVPVEQRDAFPGRIFNPGRLRVLVKSGLSEGASANQEVLRGFYSEEQRDPHLHDKMAAGLGLTPGQIKDAWAAPDAVAPARPGELVEA